MTIEFEVRGQRYQNYTEALAATGQPLHHVGGNILPFIKGVIPERNDEFYTLLGFEMARHIPNATTSYEQAMKIFNSFDFTDPKSECSLRKHSPYPSEHAAFLEGWDAALGEPHTAWESSYDIQTGRRRAR
jgi:hypothetical protein